MVRDRQASRTPSSSPAMPEQSERTRMGGRSTPMATSRSCHAPRPPPLAGASWARGLGLVLRLLVQELVELVEQLRAPAPLGGVDTGIGHEWLDLNHATEPQYS